jgi:LysR family transcriptional regulator, glycine cleavage system transcriptional activator
MVAKSRLPPISLLLAVEAATRLGSFKLAADELGITPSAVSHRIRAVEALLGSPLFRRVGQGIEPLEAAHQIAAAAASAIAVMERTWEGLHPAGRADRIRISSVSAFASHFVLPNMADLQRHFGSVGVELTSRNDVIDLERGVHDLIIRSGPMPTSPAVWALAILDAAFLPIVSPKARSRVLSKGVLRGPLFVYHTAPDLWQRLSPMLGVALDPAAKLVKFETFESACEAARYGVGIALVPDWVAGKAIADGSVASIVDSPIRPNWRYWVAARKGEENRPDVVAFCRWIERTIRKTLEQSPG